MSGRPKLQTVFMEILQMEILLFGVWDVPVSSYLWPYLLLGLIGSIACYLNRYFLVLIIPIILWFAISDFRRFYRYDIGPNNEYVFFVGLSILLAMAAAIGASVLNKRKINYFQ